MMLGMELGVTSASLMIEKVNGEKEEYVTGERYGVAIKPKDIELLYWLSVKGNMVKVVVAKRLPVTF